MHQIFFRSNRCRKEIDHTHIPSRTYGRLPRMPDRPVNVAIVPAINVYPHARGIDRTGIVDRAKPRLPCEDRPNAYHGGLCFGLPHARIDLCITWR